MLAPYRSENLQRKYMYPFEHTLQSCYICYSADTNRCSVMEETGLSG
jgi:hypothetical protein